VKELPEVTSCNDVVDMAHTIFTSKDWSVGFASFSDTGQDGC
jgi:hypothetical protein